MHSRRDSTLVYSTDPARMCPTCRQALPHCACHSAARGFATGKHAVHVAVQTKGRAGKSVTLIAGLALSATELAALGKQLRTACGTGGTMKAGVIELQGDHAGQVMAFLLQNGHAPKRTGKLP